MKALVAPGLGPAGEGGICVPVLVLMRADNMRNTRMGTCVVRLLADTAAAVADSRLKHK